MKDMISTGLKYQGGVLTVLDQKLLPHKEEWIACENPDQMVEIIKKLQVRGAPLIGVAAAISLADFSVKMFNETSEISFEKIVLAAKKLNESRPTAVNLMVAMDRMIFNSTEELKKLSSKVLVEKFVKEAEVIFSEDVLLCQKIAENGASLIEDGDNILTHCNTGGLATAGVGTAFGVIKQAHDSGKKIHVYVDETRPLLQGGRLTTWELEKANIPYTLICDSMAASLMAKGKVQKIFVGSDRIATNGYFANKVGTYPLAIMAKYHDVPFYVAAPYTTIDFSCPSGDKIPVEQREADEVRGVVVGLDGGLGSGAWSPKECDVYNPSFDVTPVNLLTALVLDNRIITREELLESGLT